MPIGACYIEYSRACSIEYPIGCMLYMQSQKMNCLFLLSMMDYDVLVMIPSKTT